MIGKMVSHYRVLEKLGGGGMGVVYRGEDTKLKRTVALKFLPPELTRDERAKQRFIVEAQAASRLDHPNICTIYEIEETEDGQLFIAMACYDGETAQERLEKGPMPVEEAAGLAVHVARGLAKAHSKGIVHRDIKPGNVFITNDGRAKLLDFGLAKLVGQTRLTQVGSTVGTVAYMSPEQARGRDVNQQSDIWSLGVLLYEALTGELPFRGERPESILYEVVHEDPTPVAELRHDVPAELADVVMRCLEKNPRERFQGAGDVADLLTPLLTRGSTESEPITVNTTVRVPVEPRRRRRIMPLVAGAALVSIALVLVIPQSREAVARWLSRNDLPDRRHVAVLPFLNRRGSEDPDPLAEGLRCYVTHRLSALEQFEPGLSVVRVTEVSDRTVNTPARARDISGATLALVGNVLRDSDEVVVELELVNTESHRAIRRPWSRRDHVANIATFQSDLVSGAADMLGIPSTDDVTASLEEGGTTVPLAFDAFIEALGMLGSAKRDSAAQIAHAVELLSRSTRLDPAYALAHAWLGEALLRSARATGDHAKVERAEESVERAIALGAVLPSAHVTLGRILAGREEYEGAYGEFRRAMALDPMHTPALSGMAETATAARNEDLAELSYTRATELRADYWHPHYARGVFYYRCGRYREALAAFDTAATLAPGNSHPWTMLGATYYQMDRPDTGLAMVRHAVELEPSYAECSNLGTIYFDDARYADAAHMYQKALDDDDTHSGTWGNLAAALQWIDPGDERIIECYARAAEIAEEQLRLRPHDVELMTHLASYVAELGQPARARELLERALPLGPEDAKAMFHAGHTYEVLGDREAALEWIVRAVECGHSRTQVENTPALREFCTDERYMRWVQRSGERD